MSLNFIHWIFKKPFLSLTTLNSLYSFKATVTELIWLCRPKSSTQRNVLYLLKIRLPGKQIMPSGKLQSNGIGNGLDSSEEKQNKHVFSLAGCSRIVWGMRSCRAHAIEVQSRRWCHWIKCAILTDCKTLLSLHCRVQTREKWLYINLFYHFNLLLDSI